MTRKFGFVTFDSYRAAYKCLQQKEHIINGKHVTVKKAISKEQIDRKQQNKNVVRNNNQAQQKRYGKPIPIRDIAYGDIPNYSDPQRDYSESKKNKRPINIVINNM